MSKSGPFTASRRQMLFVPAAVSAAGVLSWLAGPAAARAASEPALSTAQLSLLGARQWLNAPLDAAGIRGKVTLVNFWTYSCINSLRALPYVRSWAGKYRDRGLVVVGVHTPEFGFEKDIANVRQATASLGVVYPVPLDSDYAIWRSFHNDAWPAFYFIGADGRVRGRRLGEGDYDQSERLIQKLLAETTGSPVNDDIAGINGTGVEAPPDEADLRSPETYVGFANAQHFASPGGAWEDQASFYKNAATLPLNHWSLAGVWTIGGEFATLDEAAGRITFRFHARDLNLVMGPASPAHPIRFRVRLDGAPPGDNHGIDTGADGSGTVQEPRMYQLIRQTVPVTDRTFEIEFLDPRVRAYDFTFG